MAGWRIGANHRHGIGWGDSMPRGTRRPASENFFVAAGASEEAYHHHDDDDEEPSRKLPRRGLYSRPEAEAPLGFGYSEFKGDSSPSPPSPEETTFPGRPLRGGSTDSLGGVGTGGASSSQPGRTTTSGVGDGLPGEVLRIVRAQRSDICQVLGLAADEIDNLQAIQRRFRQIMRHLHPDKRRPEDEAKAGGRHVVEEALRRVQEAMETVRERTSASSSAPAAPKQEDPSLARLRRAQEIQRQQARDAMRKFATTPPPPAASSSSSSWRPTGAWLEPGVETSSTGFPAPDIGQGISPFDVGVPSSNPPPDAAALWQDISAALSEPAGSADTGQPASASTTAQLINLLAGLR